MDPEDLYAAHLPGLRLARGWDFVAPHVPPDAAVIITGVDSHRAPGRVALVCERAAGATPHGDALLTTAEAFGRLVDDAGLFTGFDEVWIFRDAPPTPDAAPPSITSEDPIAATAAIAVWVEATGVVAGLGDGDGLNVVTTSGAIAARARVSLAISFYPL